MSCLSCFLYRLSVSALLVVYKQNPRGAGSKPRCSNRAGKTVCHVGFSVEIRSQANGMRHSQKIIPLFPHSQSRASVLLPARLLPSPGFGLHLHPPFGPLAAKQRDQRPCRAVFPLQGPSVFRDGPPARGPAANIQGSVTSRMTRDNYSLMR